MELKTKKGVYFSLDALIAISIIFVFMLIAIPAIFNLKEESKLHYDVISSLSALKIGEINNSYVKSLIQSGVITDTSKTVLEQIGEFYSYDKNLAKELTNAVISDLDTRRNIGIWYGSTLIASKNSSSYESARNIEVATQIISGVKEGENITGYAARAYLSRSLQTKYFYFGGFVGDGNITINVDYSGNISSAEIEAVMSTDFELYINDVFIGSYNKSNSEYIPNSYVIPVDEFNSGSNTIEFRAVNQLHIAGGYLKIDYYSDVEYESPSRYYFPGINGIVNLYDGFFAPNITSMNIYLHFNSSYETFLNIGNTTLLNQTPNGEIIATLNNSYISSRLDYTSLWQKTIPIRFGLKNISFSSNFSGNADVILITDVSGSMDWRMNQDSVSGTDRNCSSPLLNDPTTKRISLAKCIDIDFVTTLLSGSGNRVGLVSFSSSANSYLNLTNNFALINSTINSYTASGSTCVSCAINRAYQILQSQSNSSRQKFIVVMTDGVANYRSTDMCMNANDISSASLIVQVGDSGYIAHKQSEWNLLPALSSTNLNGVDLLNSTFGFAVGDSGLIYKWNGNNWSSFQDVGTSTLYAIDIFNSTLAYAVGSSGKIYRYLPSTWTEQIDIGNQDLLDVKIYNSTLGFAVGGSGKIEKWDGTTWTEYQDIGTTDLYAIDILNNTWAFAAGTNGEIYKWNTTSFQLYQDIGSMTINDINIFNNTLAYATTDNSRIYKWNGATWSNNYTLLYNLNSILIINSNLGYAVGDSRAGLGSWNGNSWTTSFPDYFYSGNSSSGISCSDNDACSLTSSIPMLNVNYSSCRASSDLNATLHSIGFGPVSSCSFAIQTLQSISSCGNGTFYASSNSSLLQEFYQSIAQSILKISYSEQVSATSGGNFSTKLYPDSYIEFNYTKESSPYGLILSFEKYFSTNSSGSFTIPEAAKLLDARVTSYSGPKWTNTLSINNIIFYNLSRYGSSYISLGDPFFIDIPNDYINLSSTNAINLTTAIAPTNTSEGSSSNKIIYRIVENISSYSNIKPAANGCNWQLEFEDNSTISLSVPVSYSGPEQCTFNATSITYDQNDAFQMAVYNLLDQLDLDNNGKIDINLPSEALQITETEIQGIPYNWNTEVQVRIWS